MLRRLVVTLAWTFFALTIFESARADTYSMEWPKMIPDEETGKRVAQWNKEMNVNPEELGSYFEGDIMITRNAQRSGMKSEYFRWPNKVIPYKILGTFNKSQRKLIFDAMKEISNKTCLGFKRHKNENDYVEITSDNTGCWSNVGRNGGNQTVNLQIPGCVTLVGTVIHELTHAFGCWHEHTRFDRDNYIMLDWNNIQQKAMPNFVKDDPQTTSYFGVSYDYGSVMHYSNNAFCRDCRRPTIMTINPPNSPIGQRVRLSNSDITRLKNMYKCH